MRSSRKVVWYGFVEKNNKRLLTKFVCRCSLASWLAKRCIEEGSMARNLYRKGMIEIEITAMNRYRLFLA